MPARTIPNSITIRMYNVGFGDCFLVSFHYAKQDRHMLIDYGSTAAPKNARGKYMKGVANDIQKQCKGKLDILVASHRHRDHISGFATDGEATGKIIASLKPDYVIQPWTEDPNAPIHALSASSSSYNQGKPDAKEMTAHFLGSLEDMHRVAGMAVRRAARDPRLARSVAGKQLAFLGEDNLQNLSAVRNLMDLGALGKAYYVNAGMTLNGLLSGVQMTVLGPPNLKQSEAIRKECAKDPNEFWQFRSFWATQRLTADSLRAAAPDRPLPNAKPLRPSAHPPSARWFIEQASRIQADQMLDLVRDLDAVMNNTSVILLVEVGNRKLLFPGDAQIENWSYALSNAKWKALLADVNLYKVGHHGSRNATPKTLWGLFRHKGAAGGRERLETLCSTKSGKHGSAAAGTEVPRKALVDELKKDSDFDSTESYTAADNPCRTYTIEIQ
jgi:hypothetical protein